MLDSLSIVKVTDVVVPDVETLPVPFHPVQTYLVPVGPNNGEVTDMVMGFLDSNHPLVWVGEPYREFMVK